MLHQSRYLSLFWSLETKPQGEARGAGHARGQGALRIGRLSGGERKKSSTMDSISYVGAHCNGARTSLKLWTRAAPFRAQA